MQVFLVALLMQCSAFALINKRTKACDEQQVKKTEFRLLKDKMDNDPHADIGAIIARMEGVIAEHKALEASCKR
ncbi:hypothetical protein [Pseudobdellovibrio sp. HCB154]|uniref:hypothetical protein n=1 Tax=Pseudobdellovibrio sp. HCB154 TaxID=3386277 RepID=UPI003917296B